MAWFTKDAIDFFTELEQNNEKEWFEKNKKRYEAFVKKPTEAFAAEMIGRMQEIDPQIDMLPKNAVFRIYRDTRFSKDKAPYKTNAGMAISRGGKTNPGSPGLYFHFDARCMAVASGCYFLEPPQLLAVRNHIAANLGEFQRLLDDPEFKARFGTIVGEKNKILPQELRESAVKQPLIFNKQFYYWAEHPADQVEREDLPEFIMEHIRAAQPMNRFLRAAID
jgi:uncharacterized protein (TIGR02453 family)